MNILNSLSIVTLVTLVLAQSNEVIKGNDYYIAAVVEFAAKYDKTLTPLQNMYVTSDKYVEYIKEASLKKADIIVFPEDALTTYDLPENIFPYTSEIPVRNSSKGSYPNPCIDRDVEDRVSGVIYKMSCAARNNSIYVVVNLPERQLIDNVTNLFFYNTNIVFDRSGSIIAKYRKYNLFNEPTFSVTKEPEIITFTTDFGVTFGTFICFDILFSEPAMKLVQTTNATDIIYPSAWFSQLPFLTATQTQAGWARANGVNLLAAGYSDPLNENGGSGIYTPTNIDILVPKEATTEMIISIVPKLKARLESSQVFTQDAKVIPSSREEVSAPVLRTRLEDLKHYKHKLIENSINSTVLCHGKLCCKFITVFNSTGNYNYTYRMMVYQGNTMMGNRETSIQACGVVACLNESLTSCGYINYTSTRKPIFPKFDQISVSGKFCYGQTVFPSTVDYYLNTLPYDVYNYTANENIISIDLKKTQTDLLTFGIFGRVNSTECFRSGATYLYASRLVELLFAILFVRYFM